MKAILRSVSRSFYLTIRWLPRALREPVGFAYLLARATDTIADTAEIPVNIRLTTLEMLAQVIAGEAKFDAVAGALRDFAAQQSDRTERTLIENVGNCINHLAATAPADRDDIRAVLQTIVKGQELDLRRFGDPATEVVLESAEELDEYTYLVAGSVGAFWTRLGFRHDPPFADRSPNEMETLGIAYGKGLQLINVLRDRGPDLRAGRGYLPANELAKAPAADVFARWLGKAETQLGAGIDYCSALTNWRLRFATALPALIGASTIALLRVAGIEAQSRKIKISRQQVRRILAAGLLASASPVALRALFQRLLESPNETATVSS
ncbi:MAG TPA: squalene/phytoene synthase family protein [Chthoniobacterales bacterium]